MTWNIGLIGLKGHQGVITNGIGLVPGARLAAVCDDDEGKLAGVPNYPGADPNTRVFTDPLRMLDEVELDIVGVCGHDGERAATIIECARRGLHIIAEKPLAMTLEELAQVREAVQQASVHLTMLLTMRFEPAYLTMQRMVAEGAIGEVCLANMQKSYRLGDRPGWQRNRATFSGIIPFIGIHALDLIRWCTGREFVQGAAWCANTGHPEMGALEDNACVIVKLDNTGSACAHLDYCRPPAAPTHGDDRLRIVGSAGVLEAKDNGARVIYLHPEEGERDLELDQRRALLVDFVGSIRGENPSWVPAEDCFRMTEVTLKLRSAAEEGRVVDLR